MTWPPTEESLRDLYHGEGMSMRAIGDEFGVTDGTVRHHLGKHGIETRPNASRDGPRLLAGDLDPDTSVYTGSGSSGARTAHLAPDCPYAPEKTRGHAAATEWTDTKVCRSCAMDAGLGG